MVNPENTPNCVEVLLQVTDLSVALHRVSALPRQCPASEPGGRHATGATVYNKHAAWCRTPEELLAIMEAFYVA